MKKLEAVLKELTIEKPQIPYVANVDASYITEQADIMPRLVSQVSHSVRWQQSVEKMVENGKLIPLSRLTGKNIGRI